MSEGGRVVVCLCVGVFIFLLCSFCLPSMCVLHHVFARMHTSRNKGARLSTERPVPSWYYDGGSISSTRPESCIHFACPRFVFTRGLFPMPRLR